MIENGLDFQGLLMNLILKNQNYTVIGSILHPKTAKTTYAKTACQGYQFFTDFPTSPGWQSKLENFGRFVELMYRAPVLKNKLPMGSRG